MQNLQIYQSLWAMELRSPDLPERSFEESFQMVSDAAYDGMCIDPGVDEIEPFQKLRPLFDKHGLGCMVNAFPYQLDDMQPLLAMAKDFNASLVNVIGDSSGISHHRIQHRASVPGEPVRLLQYRHM